MTLFPRHGPSPQVHVLLFHLPPLRPGHATRICKSPQIPWMWSSDWHACCCWKFWEVLVGNPLHYLIGFLNGMLEALGADHLSKGSGMVDCTFPSCFGSDLAFPIVTFSASGAMQAWDINHLVHALYVARMQKAGIKKKNLWHHWFFQ